MLFCVYTTLVHAQYTDIYQFDDLDGQYPAGGLYSDGSYMYGTTSSGGLNDDGVIFRIMPDGSGFQKLLDFEYASGSGGCGTMISDGFFLYGITGGGGILNRGVIYRIHPDGSDYEVLHFFNGEDGFYPEGGLIFDGTWLYGMAQRGGIYNDGIVFKLKPDGTEYTYLHSFEELNGKYPWGDVLLVDGAMLAGQAAAVSSSLASGAAMLVVVEGTPGGITDSYALIKRLALESARVQFGILVNKAVSEKAAMTVYENMAKVARRNLSVRLEYLGYVPLDDKVSCAAQMCRPVLEAFPISASAQAYLELAHNLLSLPARQDEVENGVATIVQSLMNQVSQPLRSIGKEIAHVVN